MKSINYIRLKLFFFIFTTIFSFINKVMAQQGLDNVGNIGRIPNITRYDSLEDIINLGTSLIRPLFIITFLGVVLYGAWVWLTAGEKDDNIKKAKKIITGGIIGFVIAVLAPTIVQLVSNLLGINNPFSLLSTP